jgi:hypothetical protein
MKRRWTHAVVSGHLSSPSIDNGIVTEEEDGSVSWLERSVDLVLDGCTVSLIAVEEVEGRTWVGTFLGLNDDIPNLSVLLASNDDSPVLLHVEGGRTELDGFTD